MCSVNKGTNFSLVFVLLVGWESQSKEAHDLYHGYTGDGHAVHLFDHQS